ALYRLIKANGRQHPYFNARTHKNKDKDEDEDEDFKQSKFIPLSNSNALENYQERYTYDDAGNLIKTTHTASNSWTRTQEIMPDSNRLKTVSSNNGFTESLPVTYDRSGNQQQLNGNSTIKLTFNCCENLVKARIIERPDLPDDSDYYTYDVDEMRTRKVSERLVNGGPVIDKESKIYLGNYEVKRLQRNETTVLKRQTLRVMDDETCVAVFHYWEQDDLQREVDRVGTRKVRYQLDNHLGSVSLEVDNDAQIISYEEYFPYGGTAFIAGSDRREVKLKEYRYSGKERDDATGLYYYGARYYAPWLGRWLKPDPAGTVDGLNLYGFVQGNPTTKVDEKGKSTATPTYRELNSKWLELGKFIGTEISKMEEFEYLEQTKRIKNLRSEVEAIREVEQDKTKVSNALRSGLKGDKNFDRLYRNVESGTDENLATSAVRNILKGIGSVLTKNNSYKGILEAVRYVSAFRQPTYETGWKITSGEEGQHPTGPNGGLFAAGQKAHSQWDRKRSAYALKTAKSNGKGLMRLIYAVNAAAEYTNRTLAPALASNVETLGDEEAEKRQTLHRERMKEAANMGKLNVGEALFPEAAPNFLTEEFERNDEDGGGMSPKRNNTLAAAHVMAFRLTESK
ncbi:MAG: RHS repeat domain-containing protein, partial [Xenococcus sp. (in: cyanobacteria)]